MVTNLEIFTKRLQLKIIRQEHSHAFANRISDSLSLHDWMDWCHPRFSEMDAQDFIRANRLNWVKGSSYGFGVFRKESQEFIGMAAITEIHLISNSASLGYWIADKHQQKGYAKEALNSLISFCFEKLQLTRIEIICDPDNVPSHNVALACGGINEGINRNRFIYNDRPRDGLVFCITPDL
ncbi:GNAT family N-acetyltransferase [Vibrio sp. VB16]|uniref:GNAT family N-acetyltransferase n=1 Tax=Vibrio sp. VB16 TaxID=2785746 RepID=UPI00189CD91E|nr:GNAT family protein [Vibrio sp. VB16]UGA55915.1 GNAT family N-acetyltransferase [Vibrio sp. VB16]